MSKPLIIEFPVLSSVLLVYTHYSASTCSVHTACKHALYASTCSVLYALYSIQVNCNIYFILQRIPVYEIEHMYMLGLGMSKLNHSQALQ